MKKTTIIALTFGLAISGLFQAHATTVTVTDNKDIYFQSDYPTSNFVVKKAMMIAGPTSSQNRTEQALVGFDASSIKTSFDAQYGSGNWTISSISLTLKSDTYTVGTQPGNTQFNKINSGSFALYWSSNDTWTESGVTWNNSASYLTTTESLGTFNYPGGSIAMTWSLSLTSGILNDIYNGNTLSIWGAPTAGSQVAYLFNTNDYVPSGGSAGDYAPVLSVKAVPEPTSAALLLLGLLPGAWVLRSRQRAG